MFGLHTGDTMTTEVFRLIRDCIYDYCGIHFDEGSRYLLEKRLARRLGALGIPTFHEYYLYLNSFRSRDQEFMDIMDILTTNETYFFRESAQLKAFSEEVIPELINRKRQRGDRTLRIWSAGCSTGEEAYTIAMLLRANRELAGWNVEIFGTDISQRVLEQARRAVYGKASFRVTDEACIRQYFAEQDGGLRVCDGIRSQVTFSRLNLYDLDRSRMPGRMDVIFCRNVIIYFDLAAKKRVVESFHGSLVEGGFLLLGHSETLMNVTTLFTLRHFKNDMIYQKPEISERRLP